ncbi:plasmid stabilization protein [Candidatus Williamhamiltonella defendens]|uniref:Plasmid stabilization protein n=2 Tax=Candidatus Williamhamiltonella defendens TaxID=138072 RepID=A0A2D3SWK8_9ENTR|nr:type II toxin-antitoxin system RelE/ParE family toxin [Candidatus Hamiltonella defensa]ACQ67655.1 addiction module [Candidatus Hamiltonella defensa 5AT (Acyrthosiphon pisum)]ATW22354.1 plasmid stabilization protein [Candidatus Hamiltonella defensa]ATW30264.1 plasmid stabilization protein [Candidatus Hamiltonella defensa]ATW32275.1 plasmid stabilization protein [Candidatus Hamiltonella defensa]ATW34208.1 plasmid stabilization protein [Candidatus Hamiltonella defensa]
MPQVIIQKRAQEDLVRLQAFLKRKNPLAARKAAKAISNSIKLLIDMPSIGRPVEGLNIEFRELIIDFGSSGYVLLYRDDTELDRVVILSIKHQKESGYQ